MNITIVIFQWSVIIMNVAVTLMMENNMRNNLGICKSLQVTKEIIHDQFYLHQVADKGFNCATLRRNQSLPSSSSNRMSDVSVNSLNITNEWVNFTFLYASFSVDHRPFAFLNPWLFVSYFINRIVAELQEFSWLWKDCCNRAHCCFIVIAKLNNV